jgi:glucokinase
MTDVDAEIVGLVGDVGGTNARFAIAEVRGDKIRLRDARVLAAADYKTSKAALTAYLGGLKDDGPKPEYAVVAAAGPVVRGTVTFTNNRGWKVSDAELIKAGGLKGARVINDFTAQALALDYLKGPALKRIGPRGIVAKTGSAVIIGPGTGFGGGARVFDGTSWATVTGEGGHSSWAAAEPVEIEILKWITAKYGRASVERVLSGPGLLNLYQALGEIEGAPTPLTKPDAVTKAALAGDRLARTALDRFCAILGATAGDFALCFGAVRGVYISGGIAPDIFEVLAASDFRKRFESKGRMSDYLKPIPTHVVVEPHAALIGSASVLKDLAQLDSKA